MLRMTGRGFGMGQIVMTPGVENTFTPEEMVLALTRHAARDWGEMPRCTTWQSEKCSDEEYACDWHKNNAAVADDERLMSAYSFREQKMWVITEWDRSVTTLLLPDEY